jgi:hypothetical protein
VIIKGLAYTCRVLFSTLVITWIAYCLLCTYRAVFCVGSHRVAVSLHVLDTSLYRGGAVEFFNDRSIFLHRCHNLWRRALTWRTTLLELAPPYEVVAQTYFASATMAFGVS